MRKSLLALVSALALCVVSFSALAASDKIGVVNLREVMAKAPQVAKIRANLKKQFDPQEKKVLAAQKMLEKNMEKLHKDASVMSTGDRKKLDKKILSEQQSLQKKQIKFQQDLITAQNEAFQKFLKQVKGIVSKIARKKDINLVLTKSSVAYASSNLDITDAVVKELKN